MAARAHALHLVCLLDPVDVVHLHPLNDILVIRQRPPHVNCVDPAHTPKQNEVANQTSTYERASPRAKVYLAMPIVNNMVGVATIVHIF